MYVTIFRVGLTILQFNIIYIMRISDKTDKTENQLLKQALFAC